MCQVPLCVHLVFLFVFVGGLVVRSSHGDRLLQWPRSRIRYLSLSLSLSLCAAMHLCVVFIFLNIQNLVGLLQRLRERE